MAEKCVRLLGTFHDHSSRLVGSDLQGTADEVMAYVMILLSFEILHLDIHHSVEYSRESSRESGHGHATVLLSRLVSY
jgi:hypothetical protein